MNREDRFTDVELQEMEELKASLKKDDYFAKRKHFSYKEGCSGFLFGFFLPLFISVNFYWLRAINKIGLKVLLCCLISGILVAFFQARYVTGSIYGALTWLLSCLISWLLVYGIEILFI